MHCAPHFDEESEAEVAVLQQHPVARGDPLVEQLARRRLLALAHGDAQNRRLALLGEVDNGAGGVRSHRE